MPTTASNDSIRFRVNKELKEEAGRLLNSMGLNFSDFFRMSLLKLVNEKKMPFAIDVPNQETVRAMQAADKGEVTYHESVSSYFTSRGK